MLFELKHNFKEKGQSRTNFEIEMERVTRGTQVKLRRQREGAWETALSD